MTASDEWRLRLLGRFRLTRGAEQMVLPRRKVESLLAYLALHPEEQPRDRLSATLWGESADADARHSLRNGLYLLSQTLGSEAILCSRDTVQMNPRFPLWIDAAIFRRQAASFLSQPTSDVHAAGLDIYTGDLLADFYDDWIISERDHLRALYVETILRVVQSLRSQGQYDRAIQFAQRVLAIEPAQERAHQHMMFCFIAMGDRSAALRQYEACKQALLADLGVDPAADTTALYRWIRGLSDHSRSSAASITNLPVPLSSFVGRAHDMAEVKQLLPRARLLTLTGPAGSGKTRLAVQIASDLVDRYRDGVWFIHLAGVQDEAGVALEAARVLGVRRSGDLDLNAALASSLQGKQVLLVLDNCEHLLVAAAELAHHLLASSSSLSILATSRQPLGIAGEVVWQVRPLSLPTEQSTRAIESLTQFESIRLFAERARSARPDMALTDQDASALAAICQQLDGMPLAIELAAVHTRALSIGQIADHLEDSLDLLRSSGSGPARHRSLRAAIEWSYNLLSAEEQALLRALAVFIGGCSLAGAKSVADNKGSLNDAAYLISQLVDKSLLVASEADSEQRYSMLHVVRQFAWDRLEQAGEKDAAMRRYAAFLAHVVDDVELKFAKSDPHAARQISVEYNNLRHAIAWCQKQGEIALGLRLVPSPWVCVDGDVRDPNEWLAALLAAPADVPSIVRGRALAKASSWSRWQGDLQQGMPLAEESLALCRQSGDKPSIALATHQVGRAAMEAGQIERAVPSIEQALAMYRELGYNVLSLWPLVILAYARMQQGEIAQADRLCDEVLAGAREFDVTWGLQMAALLKASMARERGDLALAADLDREALLAQARGEKRDIGIGLQWVARTAAQQGRDGRAAILWGAALNALQRYGVHSRSTDETAALMGRVRDRLGVSAFDDLAARGQGLSIDDAVDYALGNSDSLTRQQPKGEQSRTPALAAH